MELTTITAHRPGPISPILKPGENVAFLMQGSWNFYQVLMHEPLQMGNAILQDIGAIAAGAASAITQSTGVRADTNRLLQVRFAVLDDIRVAVFQAQASAKFANLAGHTQISLMSAQMDPDAALTETFAFEDTHRPWFQVTNPTGVNVAQSRIIAWGIQYILDPLPKSALYDDAGNIRKDLRATKVIASAMAA